MQSEIQKPVEDSSGVTVWGVIKGISTYLIIKPYFFIINPSKQLKEASNSTPESV